MLKNWLTSGAIAFGVSFICVLPFNQNLAQSALLGLATMPGAIVCSSIKLRQRNRQIDRQIASETSRLHRLRQQSEQSDFQLKTTLKARQSLEARVRQLNNLVANLTDRLDRDTQSQHQLEQNLASIVTYCEEREQVITKLNSNISSKQASLLDLTAQLNDIRQQLERADSELTKKQIRSEYLATQIVNKTNELVIGNSSLSAVRSELNASQAELANLATARNNNADRDDRALVNLRGELGAVEVRCKEKQAQLEYLEAQLFSKNNDIVASDRELQLTQSQLANRHAELADIETQLQAKITAASEIDLDGLKVQLGELSSERDTVRTQLATLESQLLAKSTAIASSDRSLQLIQSELSDRQAELADLIAQIQAQTDAASQIDIVALRSQLNSIELQSREKQAKLAELETQWTAKNTEMIAIQNNLEFTQLELQDRQTELADLEAKIYAKLEEMDDVDRDLNIALQRLEPQPPQISRAIDNLPKPGEWHQHFIENPHLEILQHIEKHGAIAESEVSHKLGNPRSVRQFANKLEEYTQYLPFTIRVESSPQGNRYLRDSHN